jgi:NADH dehydrogenase
VDNPHQRNKSQPHVIVIGAGFAGLAAAKRLASKPVRVTLYDRSNYHLFQPLLYQVALGALAESDIAVPVRSIFKRYANVSVVLGEVKRIDLEKRALTLEDGSRDEYDSLIVAAGAVTSYAGHDEWAARARGLKTLDDALAIRRRVLLAFEAADRAKNEADRRRLLSFVIVGGGPTGVELAGAIADLSRDILRSEYPNLHGLQPTVTLLEVSERVLTPLVPELSASAEKQLGELGVQVRTKVNVSRIDDAGVWLGEELVPAGTVLWGAGVTARPVAEALGLPTEKDGRVAVNEDCSLPGFREVFVVGDLAAFRAPGQDKPLPGVSPVAMQAGRAAAANVLRDGAGKARRPFVYDDRGFMATIGRARAVAQLKRVRLSGLAAWLAWVGLHLWYLVGFRNRLSVFLNWTWAYVGGTRGARVVVAPSAVRARDLSTGADARKTGALPD